MKYLKNTIGKLSGFLLLLGLSTEIAIAESMLPASFAGNTLVADLKADVTTVSGEFFPLLLFVTGAIILFGLSKRFLTKAGS